MEFLFILMEFEFFLKNEWTFSFKRNFCGKRNEKWNSDCL